MGHHKKKKKNKSKHRRHSSSDSDTPDEHSKKQKIIGPSLPTILPQSTPPAQVIPVPSAASSSSQSDSYGPQLPPHLTGPQLPPHLLKPKVEVQSVQEDDDNFDDGNVIGPLPASLQPSSSTQQALDERAEILKYEFLLKGTETDDTTHRDTWMTELPPEKASYFGLESRKFRASAPTGDSKNRSLWTETPLDKNKSQQQQQQEPVDETSFEELVVEQRNKIMDQIVQKNQEKRDKKSLLEIHREKLKQKKEKNKDEKQTRRPFDRDVDLEVNKFDDAQKKSMLKKAQFLDSRFAHGKSKYL